MPAMKVGPRGTPAPTAAVRWVDGYLLPLVGSEIGRLPGSGLRCLQIEPDDEEEAMHLRRLGHHCEVILCDPGRLGERHWERTPLVASDPAGLPVADQSYDLVWSGAFGRLNPTPERRRTCARELLRVCSPRGGVLLTQGNAACALDLSSGIKLSLGRARPDQVTYAELQRAFLGEAGFAAMHLKSVAGHFGWTRVPRLLRVVAIALERYLEWASRPDRPRRYASALNPMFGLWFTRGTGGLQ